MYWSACAPVGLKEVSGGHVLEDGECERRWSASDLENERQMGDEVGERAEEMTNILLVGLVWLVGLFGLVRKRNKPKKSRKPKQEIAQSLMCTLLTESPHINGYTERLILEISTNRSSSQDLELLRKVLHKLPNVRSFKIHGSPRCDWENPLTPVILDFMNRACLAHLRIENFVNLSLSALHTLCASAQTLSFAAVCMDPADRILPAPAATRTENLLLCRAAETVCDALMLPAFAHITMNLRRFWSRISDPRPGAMISAAARTLEEIHLEWRYVPHTLIPLQLPALRMLDFCTVIISAETLPAELSVLVALCSSCSTTLQEIRLTCLVRLLGNRRPFFMPATMATLNSALGSCTESPRVTWHLFFDHVMRAGEDESVHVQEFVAVLGRALPAVYRDRKVEFVRDAYRVEVDFDAWPARGRRLGTH
ncbi:hypothetical protein K438DRAFT_1790031 [Mycena galopus ATCC 62051]|nr:hypothetical protein K438DRAFT_1790031 [Mycena galopus ATCC 62051]